MLIVENLNKNVKFCRKTEPMMSRLKGCHIYKFPLCFTKFELGWGVKAMSRIAYTNKKWASFIQIVLMPAII
jgi:hypothetical protein